MSDQTTDKPKRRGRKPDEVRIVARFGEDTPENRESVIEGLLFILRWEPEVKRQEAAAQHSE